MNYYVHVNTDHDTKGVCEGKQKLNWKVFIYVDVLQISLAYSKIVTFSCEK